MIALLILAAPASPADATPATDPIASGPTVIATLDHDTSLPLTALSRGPGNSGLHRVKPHRPIPSHSKGDANPPTVPQHGAATPTIANAPTLLTSFEGIGNGFTGPQGTFSVNAAPPDTNGAVGPNHYAMTVNTDFAIFNKTGAVLYGPVPINTVWSGFGGGCQTNNDGDPTVDGPALPPSGAPNYVVGLGANTTTLAYWKFHVDFATPGNTTFTGPATITIPSYSEACSGGTCVPQSGTSQRLDSLADRVMYRLPYRNLGDHEAILVQHSVAAGSSTGIRWYELRVSGGNLALFQSGTYAPDAAYRWMGSIAMDGSACLGLGFSTSGPT